MTQDPKALPEASQPAQPQLPEAPLPLAESELDTVTGGLVAVNYGLIGVQLNSQLSQSASSLQSQMGSLFNGKVPGGS
ncbi:hypothetical protein [Pseudoroseomonas cervicalis]|uniref:hypothetical protein n=1 Tax=Teichococcus cervicalis TaxID=204525 RepID=UPI0027881BD8|nr:hypothetical protein [Pseudoroseomonas cervicalis]MDQ1080584.1 hypothetical protein [Pseudoroseomonas cervicalis]